MIKKLNENIWQFYFNKFGSCVYLIKRGSKKVLIDVSSGETRNELLDDLRELGTKPSDIDAVILTHLHWDHIDNLDLFNKAEIYNPEKLTENSKISELPEMKIISTPGHTPEAKCYLYDNVLFSGDTIFHFDNIGRVDLPGGSMQDMKKSLEKLKKINYEILAPGHLV